MKAEFETSLFIQSTMTSSAINALNNFAAAHLRAYIDRLISGGLISEENAMRVFAEMDTVPVKRRADVAIPGSPSGYTDEYLEGVSGVVLRNIGQLNGITGIKQSGRQNKAEMVKIIKAHFEPTLPLLPVEAALAPAASVEAALAPAAPAEAKKKEKDKKKEKAEPKEKKGKEKKEKKKKEDASSSEDELRAEAVPKKKKEKKEKEKEKKPDEEEAIEAEMWESPNGMTFLRDKENNLYDKATQELVGTWDEDAEEVIPA